MGSGGDVAVGGDAEVDGFVVAGRGSAGQGELVVRDGEADLESFGFAGPAFAFGLGDAGEEIVADIFQAAPLGGVDSGAGGLGDRESSPRHTVLGYPPVDRRQRLDDGSRGGGSPTSTISGWMCSCDSRTAGLYHE